MRLLSIASGSSGNCIYVGDDNTHILIDAGISKKRIEEGLNEIELTMGDITGILITHEHSDHIKSLGVILRKHDIPVYTAEKTAKAILKDGKIGEVDEGLFKSILPDEAFKLNDIEVSPFSVFHDAAAPLAYRLTSKSSDREKSVAVATDMGCYNDYIVDNLKNLDALLIEANHDVRMLQTGNYPYYLKQRILGNYGHLCNEACGRLLDEILNPNLKRIFLGHLSKENNYPELAFESVRMEINLSNSEYRAEDFHIQVAKREKTSDLVEI
ncbi:MAG: MBL fold metallo-hydrolase [Lachnospiraceae bacterium]|nr:MBL fold metallo-hydrolase [Lachnospiraceae bacterium]